MLTSCHGLRVYPRRNETSTIVAGHTLPMGGIVQAHLHHPSHGK